MKDEITFQYLPIESKCLSFSSYFGGSFRDRHTDTRARLSIEIISYSSLLKDERGHWVRTIRFIFYRVIDITRMSKLITHNRAFSHTVGYVRRVVYCVCYVHLYVCSVFTQQPTCSPHTTPPTNIFLWPWTRRCRVAFIFMRSLSLSTAP